MEYIASVFVLFFASLFLSMAVVRNITAPGFARGLITMVLWSISFTLSLAIYVAAIFAEFINAI